MQMKNIVVYYSNKGSNKFLAERIARRLNCDIEAIRPRINVFLLFLLKVNAGIRPLKHKMKDYDQVILCGPIWVGRFIPPLKSFVKKYKNDIKNLVFVSCCGSAFDKKDEKFGHNLVFKEVKEILPGKCSLCQAFPIGLVIPDSLKDNDDAFMKTRLNETNFNGEISEVFESFIKMLESKSLKKTKEEA